MRNTVTIIKSALNKNYNYYYYQVFLEKCSYIKYMNNRSDVFDGTF